MTQYLDYNPNFRYFGRSWGAGDEAAFERELRRRGIKGARANRFRRNHPGAYRTFDPVEAQLYSAFQPELSAIDRERKARSDTYARMFRNLGGFYGALGPLLSGIPGAVSGTYKSGADTMTASGEGYGSVLNADQAANAEASNALLGELGSPAQIAAGDAGGVLAGVAGWIPATMMGEEGKAWSDRAANFPKEASLQAQQMAHDLMRQSMDEDKDFSGKIQDILAQLPGARSELSQAQAEQKAKDDKARRDYYMKLAYLELARGNAKRANEYFRLAQQREDRQYYGSQGLDATGNKPKPGYHWGPNGQVVKDGYHINAQGVPVRDASASSKKGPDWGKIQSSMADDADDLTVTEADPNDILGRKVKRKMDYGEAYRALWAKYSGQVQNKGRLRKLINQILKAKGFKKPARGGQPKNNPYPKPTG